MKKKMIDKEEFKSYNTDQKLEYLFDLLALNLMPIGGAKKNTPTLQDIKDYCNYKKSPVDPEKFFYYYEARGWMTGKNKIKNWKAAIGTWERNTTPVIKNKSDDMNLLKGDSNV